MQAASATSWAIPFAHAPAGRAVELPGRGTTWIHEAPGPAGAPVLLLLHGLGATAALNWHAVFDSLATRYRVIALDHCGHGRGRRPGGRFDLADCADDAAALLAALGIDRAIAAGYSMGGPIAELLWLRHHDRVAGLVLCATARNFRGRSRAALIDLLLPTVVPGLAYGAGLVPAMLRRFVLRGLLRLQVDRAEVREWLSSELDGHVPRAIVEAAAAVVGFNSAEWIGSVDVPTAVVITEQDELVSPTAQQKLADSIPDATVHRLKGHHGACAYQPGEFTQAMLAACDSVARRIPTPAATARDAAPSRSRLVALRRWFGLAKSRSRSAATFSLLLTGEKNHAMGG